MPHGYCMRWDKSLLALFVGANLGIALAYFVIPLALRYFVGQRKDLPYPHMFKLFAAFILSCGITHLVKVWTVYQPVYWIEAYADAWTAGVSLLTAVLLMPLIPKVLRLRSPQALEAAFAKAELANKELAVVNRELENANKNLLLARDQALEASSLKSAFIANISHELRTPLSGVLGMNELLINSPLSDEQQVLAQTVQDSAKTLLALVNDILDLSKIEAGKMSIETIPLNPRQIAVDVTDLVRTAANNKHIGLHLDVAENVPRLALGDPIRLHQILLNLVGNAVKFTKRGSVSVAVSVEEETDDTISLRYEVVDTGIGISDDELRLLFMPFTQADNSTTRTFGGTGLGLTISKRLCELMGGDIGLKSEKGSGSTFWFIIPFKTDGATGAASNQTAAGSRSNISVLVVEDNPTMQMVVSKQLSSLGFTPRLVGNAEGALEMLSRGSFHIAFLDCHLPGMDGFEAARLIRESEKEKGSGKMAIVAMTAGTMPGDKEKCLASGMDDYLAKPYTLEQLKEKLEKWLPTPE